MARRVEMTSRDWEGGPPAVWSAGRMVVRVLLVIGVVNLIAFSFGHGFFFPWIFLPFAFVWLLSGPTGGRGRGRRRDWRDGRGAGGEADADEDDVRLSSSAPRADADGRLRLEAELSTAQRRIGDLEAQLRWQARLLETATPAPPAAAGAPAGPARRDAAPYLG